jgi:phytoene synthase
MSLFREDGFRYCGWITRNARSHFALGIRLLPKSRRQAMEAVYAFCRAVDDVVDDGKLEATSRKLEELNRWRKELAACVEGFPTHPVTVDLQPVLKRYRIPVEHFEQILKGVEMDLTVRRYPTFEELKVYCQRVASAVGRISVRVFGCQHPAADRYATALGVALQLTNILRPAAGSTCLWRS